MIYMLRQQMVLSFLLIGVSFLSILPFALNGVLMDYDYGNTINSVLHHTTPEKGYRPARHPGCPTYELSLAFVYKPLARMGINFPEAQIIFQWASWIFAIGLALLFFQCLLVVLSPLSAFLATVTLLLHPLFLWHKWAGVEDMFALFFVFLGWYLLREKKDLDLASMVAALGAAAKAFGFVYGFAMLVYVFVRYGRIKALRFGFLYAVLAFFFYAPALYFYGMNLREMFATQHYGIPPHDRPAIGWVLARDTIQFYLPVAFALGLAYARRWQKGVFSFVAQCDIWLLALLPFCAMDYKRFGYRYFFFAVSLFFLGRLLWRVKEGNNKDLLAYWIMAAGIFYVAFSAPYSRSFFLFALPPLILLMAHRFKDWRFWLTTLLLTYLPMFFCFELRGKPPFLTVYSHGFYVSHIKGKGSEYNDTGMRLVKPLFKLP